MDLGKIETVTAAILAPEGAELVDLEYLQERGRWVLRVYIDKPDGVTLDDCEYFSDRIGAGLDAAGAIERAYVLEVSSPGIDRVVKKEADFARFAGRLVRVSLLSPFEGHRRLHGRLAGLSGGHVVVEMEGREWRVPRRDVDEVRLDGEAEAAADLKRAQEAGRNARGGGKPGRRGGR